MSEVKKEKNTNNTAGSKPETKAPQFQGLYRSDTNETKRLSRSDRDKIIAGVAGGLGEYFNVDPNIIRILFILMAVFGGSGLIIYIVLWLILPSKSKASENSQDAIRSNIEDMKSTTKTFAHSIRNPGSAPENSKFWWAVVIIVIGFFFLMHNYGLLGPLEIEKLWPLVLIIFGLAIILRK